MRGNLRRTYFFVAAARKQFVHSCATLCAERRPTQGQSQSAAAQEASSSLPLFLRHILHFPGPSLARWLFGADEGNGALVSFDFQGVCRGSDLADFDLQLQTTKLATDWASIQSFTRIGFDLCSSRRARNAVQTCKGRAEVSTATNRRQILASSLYLRVGKSSLSSPTQQLSWVETSTYLTHDNS